MITREVRFDVQLISADALAHYMKFRDLSVRELANRVGCSHGTIGHLRTGRNRNIKPEWAKAIEKELQAPPGSLFVPRVSTVQRETRRSA